MPASSLSGAPAASHPLSLEFSGRGLGSGAELQTGDGQAKPTSAPRASPLPCPPPDRSEETLGPRPEQGDAGWSSQMPARRRWAPRRDRGDAGWLEPDHRPALQHRQGRSPSTQSLTHPARAHAPPWPRGGLLLGPWRPLSKPVAFLPPCPFPFVFKHFKHRIANSLRNPRSLRPASPTVTMLTLDPISCRGFSPSHDMQTHGDTGRDTHTHTHRHTDTQRHTGTQRHTDMRRDTDTHRDTQTHLEIQTRIETHRHAETHTNTHRGTDRHTHTHIQTHTAALVARHVQPPLQMEKLRLELQ